MRSKRQRRGAHGPTNAHTTAHSPTPKPEGGWEWTSPRTCTRFSGLPPQKSCRIATRATGKTAMARFTLGVPPRDLELLRKLLNLQDERRTNLWRVLEEAPVGVSTADLASSITAATNLDADVASDIVDMLVTIYITRLRSDISVDDFVNAIVTTALDKDPSFEEETLRDLLRMLLSFNRTLGVTARALSVMDEYEHVLHEARIMTDMRPVFEDDSSTAVAATTIVHSLRLRYYDGTQMKNFFVALDANDLKTISELIERASKKEAELRALMAKSGMPCMATSPTS
ncbi:uncharacterized protein SOCE26_103510 [Sorangium cellulosum]|uniref:Uncharacterized protein n=2 Tax=Sorangium cellulosum TaxID=56 RepID=A0A2L0FB46_SORCE|nr:uncharacterized protein SOCE26_103510 [Sorangium cellulosum]